MKTIRFILVILLVLFLPVAAHAWGVGPWGTGSAGGSNSITMNDDVLLYFGTGNDYSIEYDGTTGEMYIKTDTTSRNIVITDGDEPALANSSEPNLYIYRAAGSDYIRIVHNSITCTRPFSVTGERITLSTSADQASGNMFTLQSGTGDELTDDNAEQAWLYIEPKINQASAGGANYVGILMDVTETATDSGTNELMALRVAGSDKFTVDNSGGVGIAGGSGTGITIGSQTITGYNNTLLGLYGNGVIRFRSLADKATGDMFDFDTGSNIELDATTAVEQAFIKIEPKINQNSGTAANYVGILMDVTETQLGTGVNELMALRVAGTDMFTIGNEGMITFSDETVTCAAEAGTADPDVVVSYIVTDGDADTDEDTVSLADGVAGDIKIFVYKTETDNGDSANVTPSNFANGTKILFEDPGDGCIMIFDGTNWSLVSNVGGTVS